MTIVAPSLKTEACRTLLAVWLAARGNRMVPRRAEVDPAAFRSMLRHIGITVCSRPGLVEVRLAGTGYREIFGFELTGRNLIDLTPPPLQRLRAYRGYACALQPCGALFEIALPVSAKISDMFEVLSLPIEANDNRESGMAMWSIQSIRGQRWMNKSPSGIVEGPSDKFQFIDLGAGVPASIDPPEDFNWPPPAPAPE